MNLKEYFIENNFKINYIAKNCIRFINKLSDKMESIYLFNNGTIKIIAPNKDYKNLHFEIKYFGKCADIDEFNKIYKNVI